MQHWSYLGCPLEVFTKQEPFMVVKRIWKTLEKSRIFSFHHSIVGIFLRSGIKYFLILLQVQLILGLWSFSFIKRSKRKQHTLFRMEQNLLLFYSMMGGVVVLQTCFYFSTSEQGRTESTNSYWSKINYFFIVWVGCGGPSNMFVLCYNGARTDQKYKTWWRYYRWIFWWIFVTTLCNFYLLLNIIHCSICILYTSNEKNAKWNIFE